MTTRRLVLSLLAPLLSAPLAAGDFMVTRYDDPTPDGCLADDCSLREAVIAANAALALDRILLSAGTYELSIANVSGEENDAATGDLDFNSNVELLGPGATMTTIDANGIDRVLHFFELGGGDNPAWIVRGVTLTGGGNASGSALLAHNESLTVEECEITGNGVIGGNETVNATLFSTVTVRRSTIRDNAGVSARAFQATVNLENVTTSTNGVNALLAGTSGTIHCHHCTLSGQEDAFEAVANGTGAVIDMKNSILIGSCGTFNGGAVASLNGNIEAGSITCGFLQGQDIMNASVALLDLSALGDAGGPTQTRVPGVNSSALGNALDANCLDTDQRGVDRATDCETGAAERTTDRVATPIFHDGFLQGDTEAWSNTVGAVE